jgi:5-methylcytosine-specific restriction endonuclease McrA
MRLRGTDFPTSIPEFPDDEATAEHLTLRCEGGANDEANVVAACRRCNAERGNRPLLDFLREKLPPDEFRWVAPLGTNVAGGLRYLARR